MLDPTLGVLSAITLFAAGAVQAVTGFGFVIVAAPIMATFLVPTLLVPILVGQGLVLNFIVMYHSRRYFNLRRVWLLMAAGVAATPVGALLLIYLDPAVLKIAIGVVVGVTAIAMLLGLQRRATHERAASVPVGAASGVLMGSTGLAGVPIILFFANQGVDAREFRANTVAYLQAVTLAAMPSFFVSGVLTANAALLGAQLLPASLVGVGFGIWLSRYVSAALFKRVALLVVMGAAVGAVASGLAER
jgi:uncharacterized protein